MKKLVILCVKDDTISTELVRGLLSKLKEVKFLKQYTTNKEAGELFEVVPSRTFFDMLEECKFLEYHDETGKFYGTPYDRSKDEGITLMINSVDVALEIKKYNTKAMTFYVLPNNERDNFLNTKLIWSDPRTKNKLLDFLVSYDTADEAVDKITKIIEFMLENAIFTGTT